MAAPLDRCKPRPIPSGDSYPLHQAVTKLALPAVTPPRYNGPAAHLLPRRLRWWLVAALVLRAHIATAVAPLSWPRLILWASLSTELFLHGVKSPSRSCGKPHHRRSAPSSLSCST
ncbi:hypothetical protein F2Q68_00016594 [Brassica cretica]|uniref:Uncharacterized protein n=1 Tax=Brassica cretica TaxID=69181 RepID=A0A8S9HK87_BRACR|nr:hypothetical protein F2Q68_00016594 [Brassica cretica]